MASDVIISHTSSLTPCVDTPLGSKLCVSLFSKDNGGLAEIKGDAFQVRALLTRGPTKQPLIDGRRLIHDVDGAQLIRHSWHAPVVLVRHRADWSWGSRYSNFFRILEKGLIIRRGGQMNGLALVSLVKFKPGDHGYKEDTTTIPDITLNRVKVLPHTARRDVQVSGPLEIILQRRTPHIEETVCQGMCAECKRFVYVKNVYVWNSQHVVTSGCVCGHEYIVPADEEAGYQQIRDRCFGLLKHKRNREPSATLPLPFVEYEVVDMPVVLPSKDIYLDTEGSPPTLWQMFDPQLGKVYITNFLATFQAMVKGKTLYTWGSEPGVRSVNVQVRDCGYLLGLKDAMHLIGYTLDKRYTLSDWGKRISDVSMPGEHRYMKEAYAYAARDALAVYLWRMCHAFVPVSKPRYVLDTEYDSD